MPIYEYVCRQCGAEVEKLQGLSDAPLTDCPECQASALKRKISPAGFRLAGGGWYETDFKKDGRRNLAGDGKPAEAAKSESKPESGGQGKSDGKSKKKSGDTGPKSGSGRSAAAGGT